jgi:hypothetical protein
MATFTGEPGAFPNQCEAKRKRGDRCTQRAIHGGSVCGMHGGRAPQTKQAAKLRFAALVSPSLAALEKILQPKSKWDIDRKLQLQTAKFVLENNGYKAKDELVLTQAFDPSRAAQMSDEEIAQAIALIKRFTVTKDASETE